MPLSVGTCIEKYRLLSMLGSGGMGQVYEAEDLAGGGHVAIKVLDFHNDDAALMAEMQQRFEREAEVLKALDHPHLVKVTDAGITQVEDETIHWLCMQLVRQPRTLLQAWAERRDVSWLLDRTHGILETLWYVHAQDIVHRDIKPGNIILDDQGSLYVVDFGVARVVQANRERLTKTGTLMGTLQYMALEQISNSFKLVDARADLYAVGMLLFEMIEDVTAWDVYMSNVLCGEGIQVTRPVPTSLARFIERLAAPRRDNRYQTAEDALRALSVVRDTTGL